MDSSVDVNNKPLFRSRVPGLRVTSLRSVVRHSVSQSYLRGVRCSVSRISVYIPSPKDT